MRASTPDTPLTAEERRSGFIKATSSMSGARKRWQQRAKTGLTNAELAEALAFEIGIFGGSSGPGRLSLSQQGAGLKIWITREIVNLRETRPTFAGATTVAMAREVYGVRDPSDIQMSLF